jgi:hypothetical protein
MCRVEHRPVRASRYDRRMTFEQRKLLVLTAWVATVATVGLIITIDKPNLWLVVGVIATIPAAIGNWMWDAPDPTLSEIIARSRTRT